MPRDVVDATAFIPALRSARDVGSVRRIHAAVMKRSGGVVESSRTPVVAYVNHGRWLSDCPNCNGGLALAHGIACCFDCGAVFERVVWPAKRAEIESALRQRPLINQNWRVSEPVERLVAENVERLRQKGGQ